MGNFVALCRGNCASCLSISTRQQGKVLQIVKLDGKIAELTTPVLVKDLSTNLGGSGISLSKGDGKRLPPNHKLKLGKVYYVLPAAATIGPERVPSPVGQSEQSDGVKKRIKMVITKQQLQQLLSKSVSVEEVLAGIEKGDRHDRGLDSPRNWRPQLDSIPEGND
ncbi:uncharacterized protein LOC115754269 [Rhodamnia argentea]|uniref:Uncharacterized protein LOC115754269 n=1 Tax=Rhodamnia argentea TaxID=178133 RepID=A0A8B8QPI4_9MYRT|nr:uncharacterized protein LOC115754269 [Rhodamnia argentea]